MKESRTLLSKAYNPVGKRPPHAGVWPPLGGDHVGWWVSPEEKGQQGSFREDRVLGPERSPAVCQTRGKGIPGQDPAQGKAWRWETDFLRTSGDSGGWATGGVPPRERRLGELAAAGAERP